MFFQKNLKKKKKNCYRLNTIFFHRFFYYHLHFESNVRNIPIEIMNRDEFQIQSLVIVATLSIMMWKKIYFHIAQTIVNKKKNIVTEKHARCNTIIGS